MKNVPVFLRTPANVFFAALISIVLLGDYGTLSEAAIIYESAELGPTGVETGLGIGPTPSGIQFGAARFKITEAHQVTAVGGHLSRRAYSTEPIFGAIIPLPSQGALPSFPPNEIEVKALASAVFTPDRPSSDFRTPLNVSLPPGDYALVFGSSFFGATGEAVMPDNNHDLPGASFFFASNADNPSGFWYDGITTGYRFVVEGYPLRSIPTMNNWGMIILSLLLAGSVLWAVKRRNRTP